MTSLRPGDVIAYTPASLYRRDGLAIVREKRAGGIEAKDTFDVNDTLLTEDELATGTVLFSTDDFEEHVHVTITAYHPADIHVLRTRKGIVGRIFLRHGAERLPHHERHSRETDAHEVALLDARAEMLAPLIEQAYAARPIPHMTIKETGAVSEQVQWAQRASRTFNTALERLVKAKAGEDTNPHFAAVIADEEHHELVRARRALDKKLAEVRAAAAAA
ncbi:hypothetical protein [Microbacterium sp. 77mftsu3.1]|uniref:hypothetical protein n=1 Tax=Microbacterium sp. 77mftsu3.1 TaxID=1761802 RepID=UPI0003803609|nr:hypothetical protein [Microbacterium sp. 77mftsu3.1]SDH38439.1 hypothetical protein SAMN04488590_3196 [Microbacterium sp. 77mftsu3.1]